MLMLLFWIVVATNVVVGVVIGLGMILGLGLWGAERLRRGAERLRQEGVAHCWRSLWRSLRRGLGWMASP